MLSHLDPPGRDTHNAAYRPTTHKTACISHLHIQSLIRASPHEAQYETFIRKLRFTRLPEKYLLPCLLYNLTFHHRVHKSPPLVSIIILTSSHPNSLLL
jgi:hypothetical protein